MKLARAAITELPQTLALEWLATNGLGGFACGTVSQANTRRYHGLLVAALRPPLERVVMVAKADVTAIYRKQRFSLACNEFADGTIAPRGFELLSNFRLEEQVPTWTYAFADVVLEQRIWMAHRQNTTYVSFKLCHATDSVALELTPLCTYRDYHAHTQGGWSLDVEAHQSSCLITAFAGARPYRLSVDHGAFTRRPDWYWHFRHRAETERGLDDREDLFCPGSFMVQLAAGETASLIATAEPHEPASPQTSSDNERRRRKMLLETTPADAPEWVRQLTLAADQFLVSRVNSVADSAGDSGATVIAGYPWFGDWGRDTMIALPGLTGSAAHTSQAASVLRTFARYVSQGMLPNRFPDGGEAPEYNTADATLWYFQAIAAYLETTDDHGLLREVYGVLKEIIAWHFRGTRYSIHVDPADGLLYAGEPGSQLTWMDAKIGDWVVTPRIGKAVEVNALWHGALINMANWAGALKDRSAAQNYFNAAERVAENFSGTFWYPAGSYLYDVVDGPQDPTNETGRHVDISLRPSQIFAISLGNDLLSADRARAVVDTCARELLTPVGLRSLAPGAPRYVGRYVGGPRDRDAAYHQGTVWSWLLGPFAIAHHRVYGDLEHATALLEGIGGHVGDACIGTVSEILDADAPHHPRGCFAQAWSVGEVLRAWRLLRIQK